MTQTHFGYRQVDEQDKSSRVRAVFDSVASKYDLMNDLMSLGLHRAWKAYAVAVAAPAWRLVDVAAGTGDFSGAGAVRRARGSRSTATSKRCSRPAVIACSTRLNLPSALCDAEALPFAAARFDLVCVAFGLRNMTHKEKALREMARVLKPGAKLVVLEFSKVSEPLRKPYDWYSFHVLPRLGGWVAGDAESYRYLAESIRVHPSQAELKAMMKEAGFGHVDVHNLSAGVVALHVGLRC